MLIVGELALLTLPRRGTKPEPGDARAGEVPRLAGLLATAVASLASGALLADLSSLPAS